MDSIVQFTDPGFNGDDHIGEGGLEGQHMRTLQENTEESVHCRLTERRLVHLLRRRPANTLGNEQNFSLSLSPSSLSLDRDLPLSSISLTSLPT